jgi:hypothetical protein
MIDDDTIGNCLLKVRNDNVSRIVVEMLLNAQVLLIEIRSIT